MSRPTPNLLQHTSSPYLLQHAWNPVDWQPWNEVSLQQAREEQKPIFLSVGYSTCHWCHVMEKESFEDDNIAELLNPHFISIKVDREERPDIDRIYMQYLQASTGGGGWPMSVWLTPDLKPIYAGTYFPPEDRHGRPGFRTVLQKIIALWEEERPRVVERSEEMAQALHDAFAKPQVSEPSQGASPHVMLFQQLRQSFDGEWGGFGNAPKFPRVTPLSWLARVAGSPSPHREEAEKMLSHTLQMMRRGGIFDHVGGGFHRYSVDEEWHVPHFEKMLYDQAQLLGIYLDAWQLTGNTELLHTAENVAAYVMEYLQLPEGGFASAEDADSPPPENPEGPKREGAFYVWPFQELTQHLEDHDVFVQEFDCRPEGNLAVHKDPHQEMVKMNVLRRNAPGRAIEALSDEFHPALAKLKAVRAQRPRPHRDDKVVTAWNGIMLIGLSRLAAATGRSDLREAAEGSAEFLFQACWKNGRLIRSWCDGKTGVEGFAEDYAGLIWGLLELWAINGQQKWLAWAKELQSTMDELFWDTEEGGYFNTRAGAEDLLLRMKEDYDGAEPAASSLAAMAWLKWSSLALGNMDASDKVTRLLKWATPRMEQSPWALPMMLCVDRDYQEGLGLLVLRGKESHRKALLQAAHSVYRPDLLIVNLEMPEEVFPWLNSADAPEEGQAFLCQNQSCGLPISGVEALKAALIRPLPES